MKKRFTSAIILAEDELSALLLKKYLAKIGGRQSGIRSIISPSGRGSGEKFVRDNYADQVREIRGRHVRAALVVHIDADTGSVAEEKRQLELALKKAGVEPRKERESIAILVPKRHTETWIHGLHGDSVDEERDYKRDPEHHVAANSAAREKKTLERLAGASDTNLQS